MSDPIIKQSKKNIITAHIGRKKVAYLTIKVPDDVATGRNIEIKYLYVSPAYRRQGIATRLLEYFISKHNNVVWISFWTGKQMEIDKAFGLYKKLGFRKKAYQEDYYEKGIGTRLFVKRVQK